MLFPSTSLSQHFLHLPLSDFGHHIWSPCHLPEASCKQECGHHMANEAGPWIVLKGVSKSLLVRLHMETVRPVAVLSGSVSLKSKKVAQLAWGARKSEGFWVNFEVPGYRHTVKLYVCEWEPWILMHQKHFAESTSSSCWSFLKRKNNVRYVRCCRCLSRNLLSTKGQGKYNSSFDASGMEKIMMQIAFIWEWFATNHHQIGPLSAWNIEQIYTMASLGRAMSFIPRFDASQHGELIDGPASSAAAAPMRPSTSGGQVINMKNTECMLHQHVLQEVCWSDATPLTPATLKRRRTPRRKMEKMMKRKRRKGEEERRKTLMNKWAMKMKMMRVRKRKRKRKDWGWWWLWPFWWWWWWWWWGRRRRRSWWWWQCSWGAKETASCRDEGKETKERQEDREGKGFQDQRGQEAGWWWKRLIFLWWWCWWKPGKVESGHWKSYPGSFLGWDYALGWGQSNYCCNVLLLLSHYVTKMQDNEQKEHEKPDHVDEAALWVQLYLNFASLSLGGLPKPGPLGYQPTPCGWVWGESQTLSLSYKFYQPKFNLFQVHW